MRSRQSCPSTAVSSSSSTTDRPTARASSSKRTTWPEGVRVVFHERNLGKGSAVRTALQHASSGVRRDPGRRSRVPRRRSRRRARAARLGGGARRLRNACVDVPVVVQLLVRHGQQGRHDGDERPLQLLDLGRHDVSQGDARPSSSARCPSESAASRSSRRSPPACFAPGSGSTRCRSHYRARTREAGKKLTDARRLCVSSGRSYAVA